MQLIAAGRGKICFLHTSTTFQSRPQAQETQNVLHGLCLLCFDFVFILIKFNFVQMSMFKRKNMKIVGREEDLGGVVREEKYGQNISYEILSF